MRNVIRIACMLIAFPAGAVTTVTPIPITAASKVFVQAHTLCNADDGHLWGVSLCGPLMLADPQTHAAIANVPVPGAERAGAFYRFTLPAGVPIANAPLEYEGTRFAQVLWPPADNGNVEQQAVGLMHESFHRIQPKLGFVIKGSRNNAISISGDPALDTETGRIWMRGEIHALRIALTSAGTARKKALSDALELRAYRHAILPSTVAPEHELDIMEGLAESTGIDVALPPARRIPYTLHDIKMVENAQSFARGFFFAIGPAYSELLDAVEPHWRRTVTMNTSIAALAAQAYGVAFSTPSKAEAQSILARYGGAAIEREEAARQAQRLARDVRYQTELVAGRTLQLPMRHFKISFSPQESERFGRNGTVYHHLMVSAQWGRIVVSHGDALIDSKFKILTVALPPSLMGSTLRGNGWVLTLAPGTKLTPDPSKRGSYTVTFKQGASGSPPHF